MELKDMTTKQLIAYTDGFKDYWQFYPLIQELSKRLEAASNRRCVCGGLYAEELAQKLHRLEELEQQVKRDHN
jgi:hypothetical protein